MAEFTIHTPDTAPADAASRLIAVKAKFGFIPNLLGEMAGSPPVLRAYLTLSDLVGQSSLDATEQQVVLLATSVVNDCEYCVAAHSAMLAGAGFPSSELDALRSGRPLADPRLEALRRFTALIVARRGKIAESEVHRFLDAGYRREQLLEVLLGVAMKTLSNYVNHVAETPLDPQFERFAWKAAAV